MTFKKLIWGIAGFAVLALGAVGYNHIQPITSLGDGNITALEQWKTDGTNITQRTVGKPVKITGLTDGCLSTVSGVVSSVPCGGSSGGGIGISATTTITQASHGFTAGQWVAQTGSTTAQYTLANAIPGGNYQAVGLVQSVIDSNHFVLQTAGEFTDTNMIPGMTYYLSASSTRALGTDVGYPPTTVGNISAPVAYAESSTTAVIQVGRPSIVAQSTAVSGINVGNDMIGSTYYATSTVVSDAAIVQKNLGSNRVRIAMPSWDNAIGIYNARALALYYKSLGYYVSYGVTGISGTNNSTTYASWKTQVVNTEAVWAGTHGIDLFYIGNEESNIADLGQFGTVTGEAVRFDVLGMSTTIKTAYPDMRLAYADAQGTVIEWHNDGYPSFGAMDSIGFNMYDTLTAFAPNIAFFQTEIGSKYFVSEWGSNFGYYDMIHSHSYTDALYQADLASRASTLKQYGLEAYFFAFRFGDNIAKSGNYNIYTNTGVFLPGAVSAFGGTAGNAVLNTPLVLLDNQNMYINTVHTASIEADITNVNFTAPEFGAFRVLIGSQTISLTKATTTFSTTGGINVTHGCFAINGTCLSTSGGGGGGGGYGVGTFSTTTSTVSGRLINYPNNTTDIVVIGASATTTAPIYFDPNLSFAKFTNASSTLFTATKLYGAQIFSTGTATSSISNLGWAVDPTLLVGSDIGAKINTAIGFLGTSPQSGNHIMIPQGDFTFTTAIADNVAGIQPIIEGVGVGTILRWTGTASSTIIDSGIQNPGIQHLAGAGLKNVRIICNNTSTSGVHQVGVAVGGVNGTDDTVIQGVTIEGCGQGIVTGANVYNFVMRDVTLRNNGQNGYFSPANNSGEGMNLDHVFAIDQAGSNPNNCMYFADFSAAEMLWTGGSIDDCQVYVGQQNNSTFNGVNWENPDPAYGQYKFLVGGDSSYTVTNINGGAVFNDQGSAPSVWFDVKGGNINFNGVTLQKFGGVVTDLAATTGGTVTWMGLSNTGGAVTNIVGSNGFSKSGTNGTYQLSGLATPAGAFVAVDSHGNLISTTTPSVTGGALSGVVNTSGTVSTFGSFTSSTLATALSDETGSGSVVLNTSPFITTPIITTNARIPLVIGGTSVGSTLTLQSTSGVGSSDSIIFQTGSQVTRGTVTSGGFWGLSTTTPSQVLDVNGSINIEGNNGFIMKDTALGVCYLVQVTNGAFATTTHACK